MKILKISLVAMLLVLCLSLSACMSSSVPSIGENGNWYIDGVDTGVPATGPKGDTGPKGEKGDEGDEGLPGDAGTYSEVVYCKPISSSEDATVYEILYSNGQSTTFSIPNGKNGEDADAYTGLQQNIVSSLLGNKVVSNSAETLKSGERLIVTENSIINNKNMTFTCSLASLPNGASIRIGHGEDVHSGTYIDITATEIIIVNTAEKVSTESVEHKLDISDSLTVNIDVKFGTANITIMSETGLYQWKNVVWSGMQKDVFVKAEKLTLKNVSACWSADSLSENIWLFGDSFDCKDNTKWISYLIKAGLDNYCLFGSPEMNGATALANLKWAINSMGYAPQYAVWCMGMNEADVDSETVNEAWLLATQEFISVCRENGITPILATTPSTPKLYNRAKSQWVIDSGCRYIDFEAAVGAEVRDTSLVGTVASVNGGVEIINETGYDWYGTMLHKDCVNPTTIGAQALYTQVLVDFPELSYEK